jgi:predicted AlkP superfamily pyrophosphatase or phosphodiesterase
MGICRRDLGRLALAGAVTRLLATPTRPKLLVIVLLGQFRSENLDSVRSQLSPGGFRKLLEKGAVFPNALNRATTFPSSSLATLATGAWPAQHGIVADRWYDRAAHAAVPAGEETLLGTTLLSEIASDPRARIAVVAGSREQAALFAAGVAADEDSRLFWIDSDGRFACTGDQPDWLLNFRSPNSPEASRNARWLALNARSDAPPLRTLTWTPDSPADFMAFYRSSYFEQAAVFDLAAEVLTRNRFGQSNNFDVLCILPAAMERLGYETGARSPLMQQMVLQLDRRLESLLAQLAKTPGESQTAFAFAAGHGVPTEPDAEARARMAVHGEPLAQAIQRSLSPPAKIDKYVYPFLYLAHDPGRDPEALRLAAARAAMAQPAIAGYYTAGGACSVHDEWERRFRNSFHPVRSGDVMLSYRPGYVESSGFDRGVSYGSLYNYDARVPLLFYGPPFFRPGVYEQTVESVDFAPTLARVAGVAPPSYSSGRVLGEALVE